MTQLSLFNAPQKNGLYPTIMITKDMMDRATKKYDRIDIDSSKDKRRFASEGERLFYGYLGEIVVMDYYSVNGVDNYEYDMVISNAKIEVKSISCKFEPPKYYLASVNSCEKESDHRQDADFYIFVRIQENCECAWLVGFIGCNRFFELSKFIQKGETYHNMTFSKANVNVLPIMELYPIK